MSYRVIEDWLGLTFAWEVRLNERTRFLVLSEGELGDRVCFAPEDLQDLTDSDWAQLRCWVVGECDEFIAQRREEVDIWRDSLNREERGVRTAEAPEPRPRSARAGFVYLAVLANMKTDGDRRLYKIGRAMDTGRRLDDFAVLMPFEVRLVHSIRTTDMEAAEQRLHQRFAAKRVRGEWFALSDADVADLQGMSEISL